MRTVVRAYMSRDADGRPLILELWSDRTFSYRYPGEL